MYETRKLYKVKKECVIQGYHFSPGEYCCPTPQMSVQALDALMSHGFLEPIGDAPTPARPLCPPLRLELVEDMLSALMVELEDQFNFDERAGAFYCRLRDQFEAGLEERKDE